MNSRAKDAVEFSEQVSRYLTDNGGASVTLRLYSAKKRGKGWIAGHQWVGQIDWSPTLEENADPFHVGEFLANSERALQRLPRLQLGKHYAISAYDPDSNECICTVCCLVGEEDVEDEDTEGNPLSAMHKQVQQVVEMQKALSQMQEMISGHTSVGGGPAKRAVMNSGGGDDMIRIDDGSFVTKEWLLSSLVQQRRQNDQLRDEMLELKEQITNPPESDSAQNPWGLIQGLMSGFFQGGGQSGQTGGQGGIMHGLSQLLSNGLAGVMKKSAGPQQTVAGPAGFDQANPFSSFLAGIDLNSIATQPQYGPQPVNNANTASMTGNPFSHDVYDEDDYDDADNYGTKMEGDEMADVSSEMKTLSRELFDVFFKAFSTGGEDKVMVVAKEQFVPICRSCGFKDSEILLMVMDAESFADTLLKSLPATTRAFVAPLKGTIKPVIVKVVQSIDWDTALS